MGRDVDELTARDIDDDSTNDYTLTYDAVGNLTDDGESYKYEWDPFGRMGYVRNQSDDLVAEYLYNGLGHMIGVHEDTDDDLAVDGDDKWFYPAYDERWRMVANFREDDSDPKEEFINEQAGLDGRGGSSYINGVICRDKDANTAWTSASDGTLEERIFYCQNWRGDVSFLVHKARRQVESVRYAAYGTPFGFPEPDTNSDGARDASDLTQFDTWINASAYDIRGDIDLDGDIDSTDKTEAAAYGAATMGWSSLSWVMSRRGLAGGIFDGRTEVQFRNRRLDVRLGRWKSRDPLGQLDGLNLLAYSRGRPGAGVDPIGTLTLLPGLGGGDAGDSTMFLHDDWDDYLEWLQGLAQCCADFRAADGGKGLFGAAICCGRTVVTCTYNPAELDRNASAGEIVAGEIGKICAGPHEREHKANMTCANREQPHGTWSFADRIDATEKGIENELARADAASRRCLQYAVDHHSCRGGLSKIEEDVCVRELEKRIAEHDQPGGTHL